MRRTTRAENEIIAQLQYIFTRRLKNPGDNILQAHIYLDSQEISDEDRHRLITLAQGITPDDDEDEDDEDADYFVEDDEEEDD